MDLNRKVDELRSKGWAFQFEADANGWEGRAKGPGLSHADFGGSSFEEAVERAIAAASAMEDDPAAFIAQCGPGIRNVLLEAFGPEMKYRIEVQDERWEWGPKRIGVILAPGHVDVNRHWEQEKPLREFLLDLEIKTRVHIHVEHEWPDEQEVQQPKA